MTGFTNHIDTDKYRATNGPWNKLRLNDPWSVGYVTTLIESENFKTKEEWELYYYDSGEKRNKTIASLPTDKQLIIKDFSRVNNYQNLPWKIKNINTQHGRTQDDLNEKGKILYDYIRTNTSSNISLEECCECVRFRVICETWNGIFLREHNTINNLKNNYLQNLSFKKVSGENDFLYAIDYEAFQDERLICAIQIKPKSYTWNAPHITNAKIANNKKNKDYKHLKGVNVYYIYSKNSGEIEEISRSTIDNIKILIK